MYHYTQVLLVVNYNVMDGFLNLHSLNSIKVMFMLTNTFDIVTIPFDHVYEQENHN